LANPSVRIGNTSQLQVIAEKVLWGSLDLILPPRCEGCRRIGERFCVTCCSKTEYITEPICQQCGYPQLAPTTGHCAQCRRVAFGGSGLRSLAFHSGPLRLAVHSLKYRRNVPLCEALAALMSRRWPAALPAEAVLVPVPLSVERLRERGYNQAEMLARHLAFRRRQPVRADLLERARATRSQVGLNDAQRRQNVAGAFVADPARVKDQSIILIDDVCTTGATLSACAEALLQNGAKQVWAYTLTRARRGEAD
jgi:ComF family protein